MPPASSLVSLFVPHGAPTMALQKPPGPAAQALRKLGMEMMRKSGSEDDDDKEIGGDTSDSPLTLVVASAHTTSSSASVSVSSPSEGLCWGTEHDFHGFPKELYEIRYPVRGDEEVAREASRLLERAGLLQVESKDKEKKKKKLDHGAWTPLRLMFPDDGGEIERISVVRVSVQPDLGPAHALAVGKALAPLLRAKPAKEKEERAKRRVVVLGSGNLTHNLSDWRRGRGQNQQPLPYVRRFAEKVWERLRRGDVEALLRYREGEGKRDNGSETDGERAHPTEEHLLPFFVALGAAIGDGDGSNLKGNVERFHSGVEEGILAMDGFAFYC